ncbi:MAG: thiamine-phosphate kinase [Metallosphaera sp.]|uniref:AIR synthase-like protein n=1 Tax=Metallosphaera cuprina (strain Ar-4) TaxID=1006006 RepID=F4G3D2_METCR|nr:thiamine-phosphate kinase [Metallosphaera cuprina]AEB94130.1 AIR synthase-like protein [Metallosphaera cuprina Ar-4]
MKLKEIGEHRFITDVLSKYVKSEVKLDVYSEDNVVLKIDGFPLTYTLPFIDFYDIGWKSVIAVMSDMLSYGAKPRVVLSSFGLDPDTDLTQAEMLVRGISDASSYYQIIYGGGDTNSSKEGWVDIASWGTRICEKRPNSEPGDLVYITGEIGYTTGVFMWYNSKGNIPLKYEAMIKLKHPVVNRGLIRAHEKLCDSISLGTDISDGILVSLDKISKLINNKISLERVPLAYFITDMINQGVISFEEALRQGGEEYESLFIVKKDKESMFLNVMADNGINSIKIGKIEKGEPEVLLNNIKQEIHGWDNFKGWF